MTELSKAIVNIASDEYVLSVEGLADGSVALFTADIESSTGSLDEHKRDFIISEVISILDENGERYEIVK